MWKVCGVLYLKITFNTRKKPKRQKRQSPEALLYKGFGALENISILNLGPEGRTRTDTSSLTADFESAASTNFTTSGVDDGYITLFHQLVNA